VHANTWAKDGYAQTQSMRSMRGQAVAAVKLSNHRRTKLTLLKLWNVDGKLFHNCTRSRMSVY